MAVLKTPLLAYLIWSALACTVHTYDEMLIVGFHNQLREYHNSIDKVFELQLNNLEELEAIVTSHIQKHLRKVYDTIYNILHVVLKVTEDLKQESEKDPEQIEACNRVLLLKIVDLIPETKAVQAACVKDHLDRVKAIPVSRIALLEDIRAEVANTMEVVFTCRDVQCTKVPVQQVIAHVFNANEMVTKAVHDVKADLIEANPVVVNCIAQNRSSFVDAMMGIGADFEDCVWL